MLLLENIAWVFENIQKLEGVPATETNISIMFLALMKLKDAYNELKGCDSDGRAAADSE